MYNIKEVDKIIVQYNVHIDDLARDALIELCYRYEYYITNTDVDEIMGINDFLNDNPDLLNKLKPSYDDVLQAVCNMIDYVDDVLDSHDITIPDSWRDDLENDEDRDEEDSQPSRIYGETYYDIEDHFKQVVYKLLGQEEDEYVEDEW